MLSSPRNVHARAVNDRQSPTMGAGKMFREKIDFPLENKKRYYDGSNGKNDHHA